MSVPGFSKPINRWLMGSMVAATAITGVAVLYGFQVGLMNRSDLSLPVETAPPVRKVTALGRLEPQAEVIHLSAPVTLDGDRVAQLLVEAGDRVQVGQVVAVLDSRDRLQAALAEAQAQVSVAQVRLAQVKAGAKTGEIQAQQAAITRLQAERAGDIAAQNAAITRWQSEVGNARAEYSRFQQLYRAGAVTASSLDSKRLTAETAQAQLSEAKATQRRSATTLQAQLREARATLDRIVEVRPVDLQAAEAEVESAIAAAKRVQTDLEQAYIRAPIAGQILKIQTRAGEKISDSGIADLAQTDQMVTVAEIYQTDIGKVQVGQQTVITGQAFLGELRGTVSQIGLQVDRQNVFSNQPGENLDRRVIEVKIRLNPADSKRVAGLTNLQVQAAIHSGTGLD